ncbi:hypothetical protein KKH27_10445 [bacterium]|nr:hypothetical protein [bacterium]MBU1983487.1 hypothetical protein [bacterium]
MRRLLVKASLAFLAASFVILNGCGSGGSSGPGQPIVPSDLAFRFCRVTDVEGVMHAQWACDLPTRGEVRYGRTMYTQQTNAAGAADSHDVVLSGLSFSTRYIYQITARDSLGRAVQCTGDFTTPAKATPEPIIGNLRIENVTESAARVSWQTDEPATSILYYGIGGLTDSVVMGNLIMEHAVQLAGLTPSSIYRLRPEAVNATNLRGFGRDTTLTTAMQLTILFPDTTVGLGDTILLPIRLRDAEDLAGLRIGITFQTGMIEVVSVDEGPFFTGRRGFIFFDAIRNSEGYFLADISWNIDYQGNQQIGTDADGEGIVAYARLRGLEIGEAHFTFDADSTFGLDMFGNVRTCGLSAGNIEVWP